MDQKSTNVVTGAGRGMGRTCALQLAKLDPALLLVDVDEGGLAEITDELRRGGRTTGISTLTADLTDQESLDEIARMVSSAGVLGALIHAAGISPSMADWRRIFQVDLVASVHLIDALLPCTAPGSAAVCIASVAAYRVGPGRPEVDAVIDDPLADDFLARLEALPEDWAGSPLLAYAWAKRGVQRLVRRASLPWGTRGARICSLSPGLIDTPMSRLETVRNPHMADMLGRTPLGRLGDGREIASVALFLASQAASFVTGSDVLVDGGIVAAGLGSAPGIN